MQKKIYSLSHSLFLLLSCIGGCTTNSIPSEQTRQKEFLTYIRNENAIEEKYTVNISFSLDRSFAEVPIYTIDAWEALKIWYFRDSMGNYIYLKFYQGNDLPPWDLKKYLTSIAEHMKADTIYHNLQVNHLNDLCQLHYSQQLGDEFRLCCGYIPINYPVLQFLFEFVPSPKNPEKDYSAFNALCSSVKAEVLKE